ncbi:PIH1 domain-containing protein 2 isoform X3 [Phalacrocorax aristotelis]|uniref:PIH1 domain-containing protein 2 isoform X3 n=1 Tax=Phalacrocorax aristotelis TaxID=126867 RepID=UPI003F4BF715
MAGAALERVAQLWSLLDDMAENDPQAYRQLLRQQRAEAERLRAPPEPHLCLRARPAVCARGWGSGSRPGAGAGTRATGGPEGPGRAGRSARLGLLQGAVGGPLFVNVCGWKRVPAPAAPTDPTPVSAGPLEEVPGEGGSLEAMQQRLKGRQMPAPQLSQNIKKELTLDQLLHTMEAEDCSNGPVLLKEESVTQSKGRLIEEITSNEMSEKLNPPVYEMITVKDANKKPLRIELKVELPKVSSVSECDLRISKDDITIEVPEKYKLQLDLPELVDAETTTAAFHKGKRVLFITVPVAKPDP